MELLLYLYAESPVHAGGADSLGMIDLPVQREAATGYPVIWGQSLKGALRQAAEESRDWASEDVHRVFGSPVREPGQPDTDDAGKTADGKTTAGNLRVGDAQLVAMPVPTLRKTFAWATSEIALGRLARKYHALGRAAGTIPTVPTPREGFGVAAHADWTTSTKRKGEVLGPYVVPVEKPASDDLRAWADLLAADAVGGGAGLSPFAAKLREDLLLVSGEIMPSLLRECTEQNVRVQLSAEKTVANGPFYSEYLPAETILAASLNVHDHRPPDRSGANRDGEPDYDKHILDELLHDKLIQIGGDETLGKGLVWARLVAADVPGQADPPAAPGTSSDAGAPGEADAS